MSRIKAILSIAACLLLLAVPVMAKYKVSLDNVPDALPGHITTVGMSIEPIAGESTELGGFDLFVSYNSSRFTCIGASAGDWLNECGWEYFTYHFIGTYSACCAYCDPISIIQMTAIADMNNGATHPSCLYPTEEVNFININFLATTMQTAFGTDNSVDFYWIPDGQECGSNVFSDVTGDILYIADEVYNMYGDPFDPSYNCSGPPSNCQSSVIIPMIDFYGGGIHIMDPDGFPDRGDVNLDGIPYTIPDAVTFTNYFIYGLPAFQYDVVRQIKSTEINCDQIVLTLADLVYLIRIITGDAYPLYCDPPQMADQPEKPTIDVAESSVADTMGFFGAAGHPGMHACLLNVYAANSFVLGGLQARIEYDPDVLTPCLADPYSGDSVNIAYELLGRAIPYGESGRVICRTEDPGELIIYFFPNWSDYDSQIPVGSGNIMGIYFDVNPDADPGDVSPVEFVTEGYYYNLFTDFWGSYVVEPTLINGDFTVANDTLLPVRRNIWQGLYNFPLEFSVTNHDSISVVDFTFTYDTDYITPRMDPEGGSWPWGIGEKVNYELTGLAQFFEMSGTSGAMVGMPEPGKIRVSMRPWSDIWFHPVTIPPGSGPIIKIFFDAHPPIPSLIFTPILFDPSGFNGFMRWNALSVFPDLINGHLNVTLPPPRPSCPVLFSQTEGGFVMENPLLTLCEVSSYTDVVTDYYKVKTPVKVDDGEVRFQIRELEDEITYLQYVDLLTVDHSSETEVACAVDGSISTYDELLSPIRVVDQNGEDVTSLVASEDGVYYTSDEPGYLEATFPKPVSKDIGFNINSSLKPACPIPDTLHLWPKTSPSAESPGRNEVTVAIDAGNGVWQNSQVVPYRENPVYEVIKFDPQISSDENTVTIRISWTESYATDALTEFVSSDEIPVVTNVSIDKYDVLSKADPDKNWVYEDGKKILKMVKDDVLDLKFRTEEPTGTDIKRDYIIRVVGRYEPDFTSRTELTPGTFQLYENYPNPFNPSTTISYDLAKGADVRLDIFNILGQHISTLVNTSQEAGHYEVLWNATDGHGQSVASGIYFYRLSTNEATETKKMMLLK